MVCVDRDQAKALRRPDPLAFGNAAGCRPGVFCGVSNCITVGCMALTGCGLEVSDVRRDLAAARDFRAVIDYSAAGVGSIVSLL